MFAVLKELCYKSSSINTDRLLIDCKHTEAGTWRCQAPLHFPGRRPCSVHMEVGVRLSGYRRHAAAQEEAPPAALEEDDECACMLACIIKRGCAVLWLWWPADRLPEAAITHMVGHLSWCTAERRSLLCRVVQRSSVLWPCRAC